MNSISIIYMDLSLEIHNPFATKLHKPIIQVLRNNPSLLVEFSSEYPDYDLTFTVVTQKDSKELSLKGPEIHKRQKEMDFAIYLPNTDLNPTDYINYVFEGIGRVLGDYGVSESDINNMVSEVNDLIN